MWKQSIVPDIKLYLICVNVTTWLALCINLIMKEYLTNIDTD